MYQVYLGGTMALAGLEEIDWPSMTHAYGPAVSTAAELRALISKSDAERSGALASLTSSINHQGDVYPATAAAVPFLVEIAAMEEVPADFRKWVMVLLHSIAQGNVNLRRHHPELAAEAWGQTLETSLREAAPHLLDVLRSRDGAEVRAWAIWVIQEMPPTRIDLQALRTALADESDAVVKATIARTLPDNDPLMLGLISAGQDPLVRLSAAAQLIPGATDVKALVAIAMESVPQIRRFAEMPSTNDWDSSSIRLIGHRLGIAASVEQVRWIEHWLSEAAWRSEALYAAWDAADHRRSVARRLVDPITDIFSRSISSDLETLQTAASTLIALGLPGVERLRQVAGSLEGWPREAVAPFLESAQNQLAVSRVDYWLVTRPSPAPPAELAAVLEAVAPDHAFWEDAMKALADLARYGPSASDQAAAVEKLLDHPRSVLLRVLSARALAKITGDYARSVAVLIENFAPGREGVLIATILGEFGSQATAALPMLHDYVDRDLRPSETWALDDDVLVGACAEAIKQIEGTSNR